ncbi:MAG: DUF1440 domain-containing protein [Gemmatimonadetes bacterium]|nr:DUF1440 domain-containing protein [Gemmatimonadota bacterium]
MRERTEYRRAENGDLVTDMIKGAVAGAVGVWVMDKVGSYMWNHEDLQARQQEREARPGGLDPAHAMANRAAEVMGTELTPRQPHPAGVAVHYGLGVMPGALYGALHKRVGGVGAAGGLAYGLGLFLLQDEGLNPIIGTSGKPREYPTQAHWRGLVSHLVLGAVTDATVRALDQVV